jgi:hypothetical protein
MHSEETRRRISNSIKEKWKEEDYKNKIIKSKTIITSETREKLSEKTKNSWLQGKYTNKEKSLETYRTNYLDSFKEKHKLFCKIETPIIDGNIKVKCKKCGNLFEPSYIQLYERLRAIENPRGFEENHFYCSIVCKGTCHLYRKKTEHKNKNEYYTREEYQTFRKYVLERDNYICQFCDEKATDVHHEKPQKLEPFYSLDPDYAWSCCEKCHYEKGHKDDCSIGKLSTRIC